MGAHSNPKHKTNTTIPFDQFLQDQELPFCFDSANMKQKIVIKLQMDCDKCRNKALKIAAEVSGVTAVSLEGDEKDRVAVTGEDVDMVCLANQLKRKFRTVIILTVEDLIKKAAEEKKKKEKVEEEKKKKQCCAALCLPSPCDTCTKCHTSTCHGKCDTCSKCQSAKCDGKCTVIICIKCKSPKCHGECKPCSECENPKCDGHSCAILCLKCQSSKCKCKPPSPSFRSCHPWCTCPKCYVPYYPPCNPYPYPCQVVYDRYPDTGCSIM